MTFEFEGLLLSPGRTAVGVPLGQPNNLSNSNVKFKLAINGLERRWL